MGYDDVSFLYRGYRLVFRDADRDEADPPCNAGQQQMYVSREDQVWLATAFEKGKIPERAPPAVYCR